ncbi:hypothetical protein ACP275_13G171100 [Erythranthe tilingii]
MKSQIEEEFSDFYEKWVVQLEEHLRLLLVVSKEKPQEAVCEAVVSKLTAHHKEYYTVKWASAADDVLAFFTPLWLTALENAYLWVTGWKPSMAFRLVESLKKADAGQSGGDGGATLAGLTEEQVRKIEGLRVKMKAEEEKVEREMERMQVAMADRKMVELAGMERVARKNEDAAAVGQVDVMVNAAVKGLLCGLEKVMKMADCVRLKTLKGVLDVLNPMQSVDFLAATTMLQIQMKKWGAIRDKRCRIDNQKKCLVIINH